MSLGTRSPENNTTKATVTVKADITSVLGMLTYMLLNFDIVPIAGFLFYLRGFKAVINLSVAEMYCFETKIFILLFPCGRTAFQVKTKKYVFQSVSCLFYSKHHS